jgi:hypothetical protein
MRQFASGGLVLFSDGAPENSRLVVWYRTVRYRKFGNSEFQI